MARTKVMMTNDDAADQPAVPDSAEATAPSEAAPIVALDAAGRERPRSGGSFIRVDGKLQRKDA